MALFEAVRGADGMMTGNPSATINYIRRRPTKDSAPDVSTGFGSRDNLRVTSDVSKPLNAEGTISGRGQGAKRSSCICVRCAMYPKR